MAEHGAMRISIHAPRAGRDKRECLVAFGVEISIHAPRAGRDIITKITAADCLEISIHAPRAGRDN